MFDTETFIREVMKRPALYSSRTRESGDSKIAHWEEIGRVIYKEWPSLHRPEERMDRIRELRKKWKSVRDNFLRDMKSPSSRKKRYVYHDLMTFLIPHLDPRRWHSGEEDCSDGDYNRPPRIQKRKDHQQQPRSANRDFLLSLVPLLDDLAEDDLIRVRQEVMWTLEAASQSGRERRLIGLVASYPALWDRGHPYFGDSAEETSMWLHIAHESCLPVEECRKIWEELITDLKRHLDQPEPREKWKYEEEMTFCIPYLIQERDEKEIKKEEGEGEHDIAEEEAVDEDGRLPVELCQVECPASPSDHGTTDSDTLTDFFVNMARTVATFPPRLQAHVKSEVFRAVNTAELEVHSAHHPLHMSLQIHEVHPSLPSVSRLPEPVDLARWMGKTEHRL